MSVIITSDGGRLYPSMQMLGVFDYFRDNYSATELAIPFPLNTVKMVLEAAYSGDVIVVNGADHRPKKDLLRCLEFLSPQCRYSIHMVIFYGVAKPPPRAPGFEISYSGDAYELGEFYKAERLRVVAGILRRYPSHQLPAILGMDGEYVKKFYPEL